VALVGGDVEVSPCAEVDEAGLLFVLQRGGAAQQRDPLRLVLVIPLPGRCGLAVGYDALNPQVSSGEQHLKDFGLLRCRWMGREEVGAGLGIHDGQGSGEELADCLHPAIHHGERAALWAGDLVLEVDA
jgi:hypothetical protein